MKKRIYAMDVFKCVCAFIVVWGHNGFGISSNVYIYIQNLVRCAVPFFAVVTGYFYHLVKKKNAEKIQIGKIFKLMIIGNLVYFVWDAILDALNGGSIIDYALNCVDKNSILNFLIFNESPFERHLWYLGAILYALVIIYLFDKNGKIKWLYVLTPFLIIYSTIMGKYHGIIFGTSLENDIYIRNWFSMALPYICIGMMLWDYKDKYEKCSIKQICIIYIAFYITQVIEAKNLAYTAGDFYISTPFLTVLTTVLLIKLSLNKDPNKIENFFAYVGKTYTLDIYIYHLLISDLVKMFLNNFNISINQTFIAIIVYILCILLCAVKTKIYSCFKPRKVA